MTDPRIGKAVIANRDIDHIWDEYDVDVQFGRYIYYSLILGADVAPLYPDE